MKTRTWSGPEKEEAIRGYYRKVEKKKYAAASSEDIWKSRDRKVPEGEAFKVRFEAFPGGDDQEWNRLERENRQRAKMEYDRLHGNNAGEEPK